MTSFPEWLLWAKRLQDNHSRLVDRLSALEAECERLRAVEEKRQAASLNEHVASSEADTQLQTIHDSDLEDVATARDGIEPSPLQPAQDILNTAPDTHIAEESALSLLFVQGDRTLEEYLNDAHEIFTTREEAFVRSFLDGLKNAHYRSMFENLLPTKSNPDSWPILYTTITQYIQSKDRRRRKRRHLT